MVICGNGIWISNPSSVNDANCQKLVAAKINLLYVHVANWVNNSLQVNNTASIKTMVDMVHSKYPSLKVLGLIYYSMGDAQNISNYQTRISQLVKMCQDTGLDGISDDIEEFANGTTGQSILNFYNGAATALHALSPPRMVTLAKTILGTNGFDDTVYPGLTIDLIIPMFYDGMNTPGYVNQHWTRFFGYNLKSDVSIGIRPDTSSMSQIVSAVNAKMSSKPARLAGFSIWSLDSGSMVMSSADWTAWNAWTGKNISGCGGGTPSPNPRAEQLRQVQVLLNQAQAIITQVLVG